MILLPKTGEDKKDYFGKYVRNREKFVLSLGQKFMIDLMVETCRKYTVSNGTSTESTPSETPNDRPVENNAVGVVSSSAERCVERMVLESQQKLMDLLFRSITLYIRNTNALTQVPFHFHRDYAGTHEKYFLFSFEMTKSSSKFIQIRSRKWKMVLHQLLLLAQSKLAMQHLKCHTKVINHPTNLKRNYPKIRKAYHQGGTYSQCKTI